MITLLCALRGPIFFAGGQTVLAAVMHVLSPGYEELAALGTDAQQVRL